MKVFLHVKPLVNEKIKPQQPLKFKVKQEKPNSQKEIRKRARDQRKLDKVINFLHT